MILEDEGESGLHFPFDVDRALLVYQNLSYEDLVMDTVQIENPDTHYSLIGDLVEHMWKLKRAASLS